MSSLGENFMNDEVLTSIFHIPGDKAPVPEGFMGVFFKSCWEVIKEDTINVVNRFSNLYTANRFGLYLANIVYVNACLHNFQ